MQSLSYRSFTRLFFSFLALWLALTVSTPVTASTSALELLLARNDIGFEGRKFSGNWRDQKYWDGFFCDGRYAYNVYIRGTVEDINFDLENSGTMKARIELSGIWGGVGGEYRSSYTGCLTVSSGVRLDASWANIDAEVSFRDVPLDAIEIDVDIKRVVVGKIRFSDYYLPGWLEDGFTYLTNRALEKVLETQLGDWLDKTLSEALTKKLSPEPVG